MVSKDVSRLLKRGYGLYKLGHAGTLDPMASGVLPILLGGATKLQDYLVNMAKEYEFDVRLGQLSESGDAEGKIVSEMPWSHVSACDLKLATLKLQGPIRLAPPIYSAVKFQGQPLYSYARQGKGNLVPIADLERDMIIYQLTLVDYSAGLATLRMRCSKGTYVRSVAIRLAEDVGTCGMVTRLVRTEGSGFTLKDTVSMETLAASDCAIEKFIIPLGRLELGLPIWQANSSQAISLRQGQSLKLRQEIFTAYLTKTPANITDQSSTLLVIDEGGTAIGIGQSQSFNDLVALNLRKGFS